MEHIELRPKSTLGSGLFVADQIAYDFLPEDIPDQRNLKLPVRVGDDGNCLPCYGSVHEFGIEDTTIKLSEL
jgi:hypothetical protein